MIPIPPLKPEQRQRCGTCQHWGQPIDEAKRNAWCFGLLSESYQRLTHFHAGGMCVHYAENKLHATD